MIRLFSRVSSAAHDRALERRFQHAWDRAIAWTSSDSHLDEVNAIFARSHSDLHGPSARHHDG